MRWLAVTDGIRKGHDVGALLHEFVSKLDDVRLVESALDGAAKGRGNSSLDERRGGPMAFRQSTIRRRIPICSAVVFRTLLRL